MSDTYDKYRAMMGIAKAIVCQSKGMGFSTFDVEKIHSDVDKAAEVAQIGVSYWESMLAAGKAQERLRAAKTLDLDTAEFEAEHASAEAVRDGWVAKMDEILESGRYIKDYYGSWKVLDKKESSC